MVLTVNRSWTWSLYLTTWGRTKILDRTIVCRKSNPNRPDSDLTDPSQETHSVFSCTVSNRQMEHRKTSGVKVRVGQGKGNGSGVKRCPWGLGSYHVRKRLGRNEEGNDINPVKSETFLDLYVYNYVRSSPHSWGRDRHSLISIGVTLPTNKKSRTLVPRFRKGWGKPIDRTKPKCFILLVVLQVLIQKLGQDDYFN